jgi:hypothetical protein
VVQAPILDLGRKEKRGEQSGTAHYFIRLSPFGPVSTVAIPESGAVGNVLPVTELLTLIVSTLPFKR